MTPQRALKLALSFLIPFQEAGTIYEDYIADEGISDDEYHAMLEALERMAKELR